MRRLIQQTVLTLALGAPAAAMAEDAAPAPSAPPVVLVPAAPEDPRPVGNAIGIGAGWNFGATGQSILEPNTVGVRFRLGGIALEPSFSLVSNNDSTGNLQHRAIGTLPPTDNSTNGSGSGLTSNVGTQIRFTMASRGPLDLVGIGSIGVNWGSSTSTTNPTDTATTKGYGVGIEWFLGHDLSLSADATNPLVSWTRTDAVTENTTTVANTMTSLNRTEDKKNTTAWGLTFSPVVRVLMHLYF
jgi:hypothetical protein